MSSVGHPIVFTVGQFSGCTIRMELNEIQKADLGRKYVLVDRRPLDPPPVVQLRIFKVENAGTELEVEQEVDYENVQVQGFICTVDLFPVPDSFAPSHSSDSQAATTTSSNFPLSSPFSSFAPSHSSDFQAATTTSSNVCEPPLSSPFSISPMQSLSFEELSPFRSIHDVDPISSAQLQSQSTHGPNDIFPFSQSTGIIHHLGDYPITESTKRTQALAGATFVQAVSLEHRGKKAVLFPFSDLAVKLEGAFILRYRVFDLFSFQENIAVIGAETYGGPFRVYATKDFPGLHVSTDLTKNLARWGVPVNVRETERRRKEV